MIWNVILMSIIFYFVVSIIDALTNNYLVKFLKKDEE